MSMQAYFKLAGGRQPEGGFFPLTKDLHADLLDKSLWKLVRRIPANWSSESLPSIQIQRRLSRMRLMQQLKEMGKELEDGEAPQPGDYVLWDARMVHTTGGPYLFNRTAEPRQVNTCTVNFLEVDWTC
jgi:hypothetical protein